LLEVSFFLYLRVKQS